MTQNAAAESRWRRFLAIDEKNTFIQRAQTPQGRTLIALAASLALWPHFGAWATLLAVGAALGASALPTWRNRILYAATWLTAFLATGLGENDTADNIASVLTQEHLPQLSAAQNAMAKRACSPMSTVSSNTTMPPGPSMACIAAKAS